MSLCNAFRFSVVCLIIVLSSFDAPVVAFTLRRTTIGIDSSRDLAQEESVILEVKTKLDIPHNKQSAENKTTVTINNNNELTTKNPTGELEQSTAMETDFNVNFNDRTTSMPQELTADHTIVTTARSEATTNFESKVVTTDSVLENTSPLELDKITYIETTTNFIDSTSNFIDQSTSSETITNELTTTELGPLNVSITENTGIEEFHDIENKQHSTESVPIVTEKPVIGIKEQQFLMPKKSPHIPKWKKYKTIARKRPLQLSEGNFKERKKDKEDFLKAETKHVRVTLQDTVTSDIPSLESLKNDLMSSTLNLQKSESKNGEEQIPSINLISSTDTVTAVGHESKRAGFLNFSAKTTTELVTDITTLELTTGAMTTEVITEEMNSGPKTINERHNSETETVGPDIEVQEDKSKTISQIVLNEDAIKEELLKEELINDNQENGKRQRDELINNDELIGKQNVNANTSAESNSSAEINSKVIGNGDRSKNSTLYTVNPNYKPMKKIDVVPPKQFVRDPDDNSWRNESLSSLGIVFKPKNSSKPFTQVLKNKTETEWNNFSEKDVKNDLPDLRERLQKMAEKRKSKRKKLDSFGNVVYYDYEENSNSAEHAIVTVDELTSTVTTYSPPLQSTSQVSSTTKIKDANEISPSLTTEGVNRISYSTRKPGKFFQYYDSTDEDDSDYLNMAQIDLKKFTTSLRTSTPFHPATVVAKQPDWLKNTNKFSKTAFPERKATVQYFPPLTTQKVNFKDYDNGFKFKMESFTTETNTHKPVSIDKPTTPAPVNTVVSKSGYTKDFIFTQPLLTTDPSIELVNDGAFDRGTYVIKHYKDFLHEVAKDAEYDKDLGYMPFTEAPIKGVTKAALDRYEKEKASVDNGYDYDSNYRKEVLQRFVDSFNQNSERYKSDFPIIFNSSIIHGGVQHGRDLASSRAFMRGSYNNDLFKPKFAPHKPCEPNCGKMTVELSPAYELHYYVPEQEEKEEAVPQPVTPPYKYTL